MLIYCIECMNMCSEDATACPRCGHSLKDIAPIAQPNPPPRAIPLAPPIQRPQATPTPRVVTKKGPVPKWSGGVAMVLSFFIPGLGQLYKGQLLNGFGWFAIVALGYVFLLIPGIVLHFCCVIGAGMGNPYK